MERTALALSGIDKTFDGFVALSQASFSLRWGEVHALLGENGAGKSSLMNIAAGLYAPEAGELVVDDEIVRLTGPSDAIGHCVGMVHQHFKLVGSFTVTQNILLANPKGATSSMRGQRHREAAMAHAISVQALALGFVIDPHARVDRLSIAEQQRVEILKVLLAGARILILDEPTAVLTDREAERLLATVHEFSRRGGAVVLVTHKMADVRTWADRVTVMRAGRTVQTVGPRAVSTEDLVRMTVGEAAIAQQRATRAPVRPDGSEPLLELRALTTAGEPGTRALDGLSLAVRAGEIYAIAGVGGNGQSELAGVLLGLMPAVSGTAMLDGQFDLLRARPHERRAAGIAFIPADRYGIALAGDLSIAENYAMGLLHTGRYGSAWRVDRTALARDTTAAVAAFDVQGVRSTRQKAALLSGGNAQKLVIAREFGKTPRVVVAHSPSRGLDVRASAAVHARLLAARASGAAVLLISEDLDEVLALAERIGVIVRGRLLSEFTHPADRQAIGTAMVGHA